MQLIDGPLPGRMSMATASCFRHGVQLHDQAQRERPGRRDLRDGHAVATDAAGNVSPSSGTLVLDDDRHHAAGGPIDPRACWRSDDSGTRWRWDHQRQSAAPDRQRPRPGSTVQGRSMARAMSTARGSPREFPVRSPSNYRTRRWPTGPTRYPRRSRPTRRGMRGPASGLR